MKLVLIFLFIHTFAFGLTFKNGESSKSYQTINWGNTVLHPRDAKKKWSQDVKNEFTRINGFSHRFELRAKDCGRDDCSRGSYKGAYGRTEAGVSYSIIDDDVPVGQYLGEHGENWYAWSLYIDDSELSSFTDNHMFSFLQFKQLNTSEMKKRYANCESSNDSYAGVTIMFKYKPDHEGLGISREYCNEKGLYKLTSKYNSVLNKKNLFNKWNDFILHVNWGEDGFIKLYINGDLKYSESGYINEEVYNPKRKKYGGPTIRYGIYSNEVPKKYKGKLVAWFDGIARVKKCTDNEFSNLLNELGYNCNDLNDKDGLVINGEPRCLNCKLDLSEYTSMASDENFEEGNYKIEWYRIRVNKYGENTDNSMLGFDEVIVKNGNLSFTKFSSIKSINKEKREKINFIAQDGLIGIEGNLDLDSKVTEKVNMVGPSEKDENGNYYVEGFWNDSEKIGILFKPLN